MPVGCSPATRSGADMATKVSVHGPGKVWGNGIWGISLSLVSAGEGPGTQWVPVVARCSALEWGWKQRLDGTRVETAGGVQVQYPPREAPPSMLVRGGQGCSV